MRDTKSILLLIVSFLLLIVSCVLLWTWGYRVYQESGHDKKVAAVVPQQNTDPAVIVQDSSQRSLYTTVNAPGAKLDSIWSNADSLKNQLDLKVDEFNKLRGEITTILKTPGNNADLGMARQKIVTLQQIVDDLRSRNKDVENENKRLQEVLQQLSAYMKPADQNQNVKRVALEEKIPVTSSEPVIAFTASDLRLSAIMTDKEKEEETLQAQQTGKLVGSFTVKNNTGQANSSEMLIVVLQPDGQVLKASAWESGVFNTPEGKKVYSYKVRFDLTKGEARRLLFTLSADKYQKGSYIMQVYHNGTMIGRMLKTLS